MPICSNLSLCWTLTKKTWQSSAHPYPDLFNHIIKKKSVSPSLDDRHMFLCSFCRMDYYLPLGSSQSLYRFLYWANLSSVWAPIGLARFLNVLGFVRSNSFKNKTDNNFIKPNHILSMLLITRVNTTYLLRLLSLLSTHTASAMLDILKTVLQSDPRELTCFILNHIWALHNFFPAPLILSLIPPNFFTNTQQAL